VISAEVASKNQDANWRLEITGTVPGPVSRGHLVYQMVLARNRLFRNTGGRGGSGPSARFTANKYIADRTRIQALNQLADIVANGAELDDARKSFCGVRVAALKLLVRSCLRKTRGGEPRLGAGARHLLIILVAR
jgi:hypothetical protein